MWDKLPKGEQEALLREEKELELRAVQMGIARYKEERGTHEKSHSWPEQVMISKSLAALAADLHDLQERAAIGEKMRGVTIWGPCVISVPADILAFATMAEMVNLADGADNTIAKVVHAVGSRAKLEREYAVIRRDARNVYKYMMQHSKNWTRRAHRIAVRKSNIADKGWTKSHTMHVGAILVDRAIEKSGIFDIQHYTASGRIIRRLYLTSNVRRVIEESHSECELLRPFYLPMVVPPSKWTTLSDGGYRFHRVELIKAELDRDDERRYVEMPDVMQAVSALQETEWCINSQVLDVMLKLWRSGAGWAFRDKSGRYITAEPAPILPPTFDWETASKEQRQEWKAAASKIHGENSRLASKRAGIIHKLWISEKLRARKVIYFPHQLDWRGRAYPLPSHLHPQADDFGRALLKFAEPITLTEKGLYWLKVHTANCFGIDGTFDERVAWTDLKMPEIARCAENPYDNRWWSEADKSWQFLASCFEMARASVGALSSLPVQVDGSCNGLQHLSALGRDEYGGLLVNLIPSDRPQDVYQEIANRVEEHVKCDTRNMNQAAPGHNSGMPESGNVPACVAWLGRVTRKLAKRPTMTIVYGLTKGGMQRQLLRDGFCKNLPGKAVDNANYMRDVLWKTLDGALPKAMEVMQWLRNVAGIASDQGLPLRWATPSGFLVIQEYLKYREINIYSALQRLKVRVPYAKAGVDKWRQVRGIPPNLVHSLDAAHMTMTINSAISAGICSLSMIHDSFGTYAENVELLSRIIREEFVKLHSIPILSRLYRQWQLEMGEIPPPPAVGNLELEGILRSLYFFG